MENVVYIALSRQTAMRRQLDVIANNLANMNTPAFRGERVLFEEYLMSAGPAQRASYVRDFATLRDLREGPHERTGNALDIALAGRGYLTVETPQGVRYTRNGHLRLDAEGRLVTPEGYALLDDRGSPIQLNELDGTPHIASDGTVSTPNTGPLGRLNVVTFANEQALRQTGAGLYATDEAPEPAAEAQIEQGMVEGANIQPIVEMTTMIELLRDYQTMQKLIDNENERQRAAIGRLARVV